MLKIGITAFGGGYTVIALIRSEFVEKRKWIEEDEFYQMLIISESTPGPFAINGATYVGYKVAKLFGSVIATLGVVLPSFIIIYLISLFFDEFLSLTYVYYAFRGIQACVAYLILSAGIKMLKGQKKDVFHIIITVVTIVALVCITLFAVNFSSVFLILLGGIVGLTVYLVGKWKHKGGQE